MRHFNLIFFICLLFIIGILSTASAQVIVFDPGHGGDYPGAPAIDNGDTLCWEKAINLFIAEQLMDTILDHYISDCYFTRMNDSTILNRERAYYADTLGGMGADIFVSIHHNSIAQSSHLTQRTEVYHSCDSLTDSAHPAPYTSVPRDVEGSYELKKKVYYRLLHIQDTIYKPGCDVRIPLSPCGAGCEESFTVLQNTVMPSCLTEASFISNWDEARRFCYDSTEYRAGVEATAILWGTLSFTTGQGFGIVDYAYLNPLSPTGDTPMVWVDTGIYREREYEVPYESCWLLGEDFWIEAQNFQKIDYYQGDPNYVFDYTFHHWEKKWYTTDWHLETHDTIYWHIEVPFDLDGNHYYVAYFTGGPYEIETDTYVGHTYVGDTVLLEWTVDTGLDASTVVNISLERDNQYEDLYTWNSGFSEYGYFFWEVTGPGSGSCRFRLIAQDKAENTDTCFTEYYFTICDSANDMDCDFVVNSVDNCPAEENTDQADIDGDDVGDVCDVCPSIYDPAQQDRDYDYVGDTCDNCPDLANFDQDDYDYDGVGDWCDNCPASYNPDQMDTDSDSVGNICDNCPDDPNTDQADSDFDGIGDVCDSYVDNCTPKFSSPVSFELPNGSYSGTLIPADIEMIWISI